jgi:hypothetical protein
MRKTIVRISAMSLAFVLLASLMSCPFPSSGSFPVQAFSPTITLAWDPPPVQFSAPPLSVSSYRLYFRQHGSSQWTLLKEVPAAQSLELLLKHSDFGNGSYDFAVSAVNALGNESSLHTSLDALAQPYGGWYLVWFKSE